MAFALVSLGMVLFLVLVLVLLGRSYPGSGADLLDWKPTRDYETEFQLEEDDISQMIAAQNAYRKRRGATELTEMDAERMAREDQRVRSRGRMDEDSLSKLDKALREGEDGGGSASETPEAPGGSGSTPDAAPGPDSPNKA